MDFILGIFTGIGLALFAGYYLNERKKKQQAKDSGKVGIYINGKLVATGTPMQLTDDEHNRHVMKNVITAFDEMCRFKGFEKPIEQQLQDAIARDDFEEAARLRDLINKK